MVACAVDGGLQSLERAQAVTCRVYCSAGIKPVQLHASAIPVHVTGNLESFCFALHVYVIPTGLIGFFQVNSKLFEVLVVTRRSRGPTKKITKIKVESFESFFSYFNSFVMQF